MTISPRALSFVWLAALVAVAVGVSLSTGSRAGAADKKDANGEKSKAAQKDDAKKEDAEPDRYALPKGGVKELLAFIKSIREFEPTSAEENAEQQEKAVPAIKAACERVMKIAKPEDRKLPGFDEVPFLLLVIRVNDAADASPAEQRKLIADIKSLLESHARITQQDLTLAMQVAQTLESRAGDEIAGEAYSAFGGVLAKSKDEQVATIGAKLEGAGRRLTLLGKPLEIKGTEMDGTKFDWAKYRGKVVLIDFWATWCGPCRAELPNVKKNYKLYHDRGFEVVGISLDDDREALEKFLDEEKNPWITLHDGGWDDNATATYYGVMGIPTVIPGRQAGQSGQHQRPWP